MLKSSSLPASFLTSASQCLPASETIKTPNRDRGRLCGNAAEMFIISTACSGVEYRKTHSRTTLSVFVSFIYFFSSSPPRPPSTAHHFPLLSSVCLPGSETNGSGFSLSPSASKDPPPISPISVRDAERMRTEARQRRGTCPEPLRAS